MDKPVNIVHNKERLVYHYTPLETLMVLLKNIKDHNLIFHASGMHYMNDSSEFAYGFKEFRRILPALENRIENIDDQIKISSRINKADQCLLGKWNHEFVNTLIEGNLTPFIISTSSLGDSIPMWAMYGNAGRGVALGLDVANFFIRTKSEDGMEILDSTPYDWQTPHAYKVMQNLSLDYPAILNVLSIYNDYLEKAQHIKDEIELGKLCLKTLYHMSSISAALIKHPAFKFENEWRILNFASDDNKPCYKTYSKGILTSYLEVKIPTSFLKRIVIGPCCEKDYQYAMIKGLLLKKGLPNCKVVHSKAPYRG